MSGPRVVDRTAVENQRWNGSGEWRTGLEARRIRVEIGDQWFIGSGSTRPTTKRMKPKEGNEATNRQLTMSIAHRVTIGLDALARP
jgi:hypothetical protein